MDLIKKELSEWADLKMEEEHLVSDVTRTDHWLLFFIGILPFLIATIWYYLKF